MPPTVRGPADVRAWRLRIDRGMILAVTVTTGAAMVVAGGIVLGVGACGLGFEAFGHWWARSGGTVNSPYGAVWKQSNAEINRQSREADARTFARLRRARPYFFAALILGIALVVVGGLLAGR